MIHQIRNIWAVGRNYGAHAKELGNQVPDAQNSEPMIFLKAGSTAIESDTIIQLPSWSQEIHHEVELAMQFNDQLEITKALVAIDLTARDVQERLKAAKHPWTLAKSFKGSTALGSFFEVKSFTQLSELPLRLLVNGEARQQGNTRDMIFGLDRLTEYIKERFPVCPGDLILTGTPPGVGPLKPGDTVEIEIPNLSRGRWSVQGA